MKWGKSKFAVFFFIFFNIFYVSGQDQDAFYAHTLPFCIADSNALYLRLENTNFFKNNEYFNNIKEGYTLPGFWIQPQLLLSLTPNISFSGGFRFLKYHGKDPYSEFLPVLSARIKVNEQFGLVLGTLDGSINHRQEEPMYDPERFLTAPPENGVQLWINTKQIGSDIWLNWEQFIEQGDTIQEILSQGTSSLIWLTSSENPVSITIPVQTMVAHRGGQINTSNSHMQTLANVAGGLKLEIADQHVHSRKVVVQCLLFQFADLSPRPQLPFTKGHAIYPSFSLESGPVYFFSGFWDARNYAVVRGDPMFGSVSTRFPEITESHRQLITTKLAYQKAIHNNVRIGLRVESYFDIPNRIMDYSYGLFITLNEDFRITSW